LAIDLPESERKKLSQFRQEFPHCRWVPENQLHLTLRFIGEIEVGLGHKIQTALSDLKSPGVELSLTGLGCFPNERYPRVLWVGIAPNEDLLELQQSIERKLQELEIPAERRGFTPHITLARFKSPPKKGFSEFLRKNNEFRSAPIPIKEFYLYSSTLSPKGAIHEKIGIFPLK
jgi:2'-5' RNA ligase